jgi:hypothetical protein
VLCLKRVRNLILLCAVKRTSLGFISLLDAEYNALYNLTDVAAMSNKDKYLLNFMFYYDILSDFVLVLLQIWNMIISFLSQRQ